MRTSYVVPAELHPFSPSLSIPSQNPQRKHLSLFFSHTHTHTDYPTDKMRTFATLASLAAFVQTVIAQQALVSTTATVGSNKEGASLTTVHLLPRCSSSTLLQLSSSESLLCALSASFTFPPFLLASPLPTLNAKREWRHRPHFTRHTGDREERYGRKHDEQAEQAEQTEFTASGGA